MRFIPLSESGRDEEEQPFRFIPVTEADAPAPVDDAAEAQAARDAAFAGRIGRNRKAPTQPAGPMKGATDARDAAAAKPAPYRDRREALDDAVNLVEEGAPLARVVDAFSKAGITEQEILAHGRSRGSTAIPPVREQPPLDPRDRRAGPAPVRTTGTFTPIEPTAVEEVANTFRRGTQQAGAIKDALGVQTGLMDAPTFAERSRERQRAMSAAAPSGDVATGIERLQAANETGDYGEVARAIFSVEGIKGLAALVTESAIASSPMIPIAAAGSIFGPAGTAAAAGAASFAMEFGAALGDTLQSRGIDMSNPAAVRTAVEDPAVLAEARQRGVDRGIPIAIADAASAGFAGRFLRGLAQAERRTAGSVARAVGAEAGLQMGAGAAGEFAAQKLTGENKPLDVILEGVADVPGGLLEAATNARAELSTMRSAPEPTPAALPMTDAANIAPAPMRSFTPPDAITAQMGLTPIVVPDVTPADGPLTNGDTNAGNAGAPAPLAAGDGAGRASLGPGGLGDGGRAVAVPAGLGADAGLADAAGGADRAVAGAAGEPAPRVEPATVWFGRRGDGYATEADAQQALAGRQKREPGLTWGVEPMPNGRFRLAGYQPEAQAATPQTPEPSPSSASPEARTTQESNQPLASPPAPASQAVKAPAQPAAADEPRDWAPVPRSSGTIGVPRAEMPQIKSEARGALVGFLGARGIGSTTETVPATSLKPTQAEFSPSKVRAAAARTGGDRAILVSSDGHVVDGHHQWLAKRAAGEDVKVMRLSAPIAEVLPVVREFPSATTSGGMTSGSQAAAAGTGMAGAPSAPEAGVDLGAAGRPAAGRAAAPVADAPALPAGAAQVGGLGADQIKRDLAAIQDYRLKKKREATKLEVVAPNGQGDAAFAQRAANAFRAPIVFVRDRNKKAGFNAINIGGRVYVNVDGESPAVASALHEIGHSLPDDIKKKLISNVVALSTPEQRQKFLEEFDYSDLDQNGQDEELTMRILEQAAQSKDKRIWKKLHERLGDDEFGKLAAEILKVIDRIIAAFKSENSSEFTTDIQKVEDYFVDALAEARGRIVKNESMPEVDSNEDVRWSEARDDADAEDVAVADDDALAARVKQGAIPKSVEKAASLENSMRVAKAGAWKRGRDLKRFLQRQVLGEAGRAKVDPRKRSDATDSYLLKVGIADALFALSANKNAIGWYDLKTRQALRVVSLIHPEIATDPDARFAFVWALAVTSNGMKVDKNFELAEQAYRAWKGTGEMPTDMNAGQAQKAINESLGLFNTLRRAWGKDDLRAFMLTNFTVGEITSIAKDLKPGGEHADVVVRGAAILGPKIGNGFFSNLYGNFDALTMDRWLIRTWGRWTGTLLVSDPAKTDAARTRLRNALNTIVDNPDEKKRLSKVMGLTLTKATDTTVLAQAVQKASMDRKIRAEMNASAEGAELRKAGNSLAKYLDSQKEAPSGPTERKYIREIFGRILEELKGRPEYSGLTMADLQAVLWYAEKRLYESAKEDASDAAAGYEDDEAPDYANAAAKLAREAGITERKIQNALKAEENGHAGRARRGDGGQAADAAAVAGGQQRPAEGLARQEKKLFIGRRALDRARSDRAGGGGQSWSYAGEGRGGRKGIGLLGRLPFEREWSADHALKTSFRANKLASPDFYELKRGDANAAAAFQRAITESKAASGAIGAAVYVYPAEDYAGMRLFLDAEGQTGFAIKDDGDIVSVFSRGGGGRAAIEAAISAGGRKLDAFDTILPHFYAAHGFRATGRTLWNDEYAPEGWDKGAFADFNGGEPDVVFMVFDPENATPYQRKRTRVFDKYDAAVAAQNREMKRVARAAAPEVLASEQRDRGIIRDGAIDEDPLGHAEPAGRPGGRGDDGRRAYSRRPARDGAVDATGIHYGKFRVGTLSGRQYGTGIKGAEAERLALTGDARIKRRVYFYLQDPASDALPTPEQGLGQHVFRAQLGNLFDIANEAVPLDVIERIVAAKRRSSNEFESAVLDAGFDGYVARALGMAVVLDSDVPVEYLGTRQDLQIKQPPGADLPKRAKLGLLSAEIRDVESRMEELRTAAPSAELRNGSLLFNEDERDAVAAILPRAGVSFSEQRRVTQTPAFKRWFGDSKVVDENGDPLVVYHGTDKDFSAFDLKFFGQSDNGVAGMAFYFSPSPKVASDYSYPIFREEGRAANVMPVYLKAENPYMLDYFSDEGQALQQRIETNGPREFRDWLIENGYDSVKILGNLDGVEPGVQWAVLNSNQIKSAIGNRGTFDPADPRINFSEQRRTDTPEFRQWFGNSKIVNADGTPKVMYHGTARDFNAFEPKQASAIFVTSNPRFAEGFSSMSMEYMIRNATDPDSPTVSPENVKKAVALAKKAMRGNGYGLSAIRAMEENGSLQKTDEFRDALVRYIDAAPNVIPMYVRAENPFDYENPEHVAAVEDRIGKKGDRFYDNVIDQVRDGNWGAIELNFVQRAIKDLGHDSFYVMEGGEKNLGVYQSSQLKSATGNDGSFDLNDPSIMSSQQRSKQTLRNVSFNAPDDTRKDKIIYALQDKQIDTKRIVQAINDANAGRKKPALGDRVDAYLREELYQGRVAERTDRFLDEELKPLLVEMRAAGVTIDQLDQYLHARHAGERNAAMKAINQNMPNNDALSGMADEEAKKILANAKPVMAQLAKRIDNMIDGTRDLMLVSGTETPAAISSVRSAYQYYVPLYRDEADPEMMLSPGTGFNVKGSRLERSVGSNEKVVNILARIVEARENAITRAEKNLVATAIYAMAKQNPNPDFWTLDAPTERVLDERQQIFNPGQGRFVPNPTFGQVIERTNPNWKNDPAVLVAKIAGEDFAVRFNDRNERAIRMVQSLKNMDVVPLDGAMRTIGTATRWLAAVNTQYNPVFAITNFVRDVQGAAVNLIDTPIASKQAEVMGNIPAAMRAIYRKERGKAPTNPVWDQLYEEFSRRGGKTGFRESYPNIVARAEALQKTLDSMDRSAPMKAVFGVLDFLDAGNDAIENAVRLSAYKAALDQGMSKDRAASLAKNLTVNFNRKGSKTQSIGALYAFFNAAVQGNTRIMKTLLSKHGPKIIAGGMMLGVTQALLYAGMDDDDEEKIPDFVKNTSWVLPLTYFGGQSYIAIPMPLGLNVLPNLGRSITDVALAFHKGDRLNLTSRVFDMVTSVIDALNPLGSSQTPLQMIAPTVADPLVQLAANHDFTGKPVYKDRPGNDPAMPGYSLGRDSTSPVYKGAAYVIHMAANDMNPYRRNTDLPAAFSPQPEALRLIPETIGGGIWRETEKLIDSITAAVTGDKLPTNRIPIAGRFYGDLTSEMATQSVYYRYMNKVREAEREAARAKKDGEVGDHPASALVNPAKSTRKRVDQLRDELRDARIEGLPRERIDEIEQSLVQTMDDFNKAFSEEMKRQRKTSQ